MMKKHPKPYKDDIVHMPPLNESDDMHRSITLIPYLEDMHQDLFMTTIPGDHMGDEIDASHQQAVTRHEDLTTSKCLLLCTLETCIFQYNKDDCIGGMHLSI